MSEHVCCAWSCTRACGASVLPRSVTRQPGPALRSARPRLRVGLLVCGALKVFPSFIDAAQGTVCIPGSSHTSLPPSPLPPRPATCERAAPPGGEGAPWHTTVRVCGEHELYCLVQMSEGDHVKPHIRRDNSVTAGACWKDLTTGFISDSYETYQTLHTCFIYFLLWYVMFGYVRLCYTL